MASSMLTVMHGRRQGGAKGALGPPPPSPPSTIALPPRPLPPHTMGLPSSRQNSADAHAVMCTCYIAFYRVLAL